MSFGFFADAGLTVPLTSLQVTISTAGGSSEGIVFFGSPAAEASLTRDGGGAIEIEIADADPGDGLAATAVRLALSAFDLDSATPGDPLDIGETVQGGAAHARAVFWRVTVAAGAASTFTDLGLSVPDVLEA